MKRRQFLKMMAGMASLPLLGASYGIAEASVVRVVEATVPVPNLPPAFRGKRVALLTDIHHGPQNSLAFVEYIVQITNELQPDLVALCGDFVHRGTSTMRPCFEALSALRAPLGVFAIPGNHDMTDHGKPCRRLLAEYGFIDVTNEHRWVECGADRIALAGLDDLWWGKPDPDRALAGISTADCTLLLAHNPDFTEVLRDPRISLILSGHMHGGQIYLPGIGAPWLPSKYGEKYRYGLVQGPVAQVYVSGGLGTVGMPVRFNSPPEFNLLTLVEKNPSNSVNL